MVLVEEIEIESLHVASGGQAGTTSGARFSACRRYRYILWRLWNPDEPVVMVVGLNPSTADETTDDPTVRRCVRFAQSWGYGGVLLTNLFAYRSKDPAALPSVSDPVGPDNDRWIAWSNERSVLSVAAWGVGGSLHQRDREVLPLLTNPHCLGITKGGAPRHPLYLGAWTRPRTFAGAIPVERSLDTAAGCGNNSLRHGKELADEHRCNHSNSRRGVPASLPGDLGPRSDTTTRRDESSSRPGLRKRRRRGLRSRSL
ncbi:MAG: hypothetical protein B6D36_17070 [Planctomycetes bacterium UTPLA1]|nr:MAG: hypothetical protein B6D36_17070 [Planctomycetes bacterium UTPLA1]